MTEPFESFIQEARNEQEKAATAGHEQASVGAAEEAHASELYEELRKVIHEFLKRARECGATPDFGYQSHESYVERKGWRRTPVHGIRDVHHRAYLIPIPPELRQRLDACRWNHDLLIDASSGEVLVWVGRSEYGLPWEPIAGRWFSYRSIPPEEWGETDEAIRKALMRPLARFLARAGA